MYRQAPSLGLLHRPEAGGAQVLNNRLHGSKIIEKGKITTDNQFYDITIMIDQLSQTDPVNNKKIEILDNLLADYERRKKQKTKTNA